MVDTGTGHTVVMEDISEVYIVEIVDRVAESSITLVSFPGELTERSNVEEVGVTKDITIPTDVPDCTTESTEVGSLKLILDDEVILGVQD